MRQYLGRVDVDGRVPVEQGELLGEEGDLAVLLQQLPPLCPGHLVRVREDLIEAAELRQQLGGRLLPDPRHAGDVVGGVALETYQVGDQAGGHAEPLLHRGRVVDLDLGHAPGVGHDAHVGAGQLQGVPIAGDDHRLATLGLGLAGESGQDVVGLVPGNGQVDEPEGGSTAR